LKTLERHREIHRLGTAVDHVLEEEEVDVPLEVVEEPEKVVVPSNYGSQGGRDVS
jgi:hypothetical protein